MRDSLVGYSPQGCRDGHNRAHTHTHTHTPLEDWGRPRISGNLQSIVKSLSRVRLFSTPWTVTWLLCPWDFPGNSTGVDCHFLLQRIFLTQGSNPGLLHCRQMLYHLSHQGSPKPTIYMYPYILPIWKGKIRELWL